MASFLAVVQIIVAILIILVVLVNITKGSEYGAVFRGGEAIFGSEGPGSFLNKVTMILALIFFINSLVLAKLYAKKSGSLLLKETPKKVKKEKKIPTPSSLPVIPQK